MTARSWSPPSAEAPGAARRGGLSATGSNDAARPVPPLPDPAAIPSELLARPQWVCWRFELRDGKLTKVPLDPKTGKHASTTDPATWGSFQQALARAKRSGLGLGVGFVVTADDPYVFIDLDHVRDGDGLRTEVQEIIRLLASYTEWSPSGDGLHILARGALPDGRRRNTQLGIEVYDRARFATVTGWSLNGYHTIEERSAELAVFHQRWLASGDTPRALPLRNAPVDVDDDALLERARRAANGAKFVLLFDHGDWRGAGHESQSEADLALVSMLAFWAGPDPVRIDRLFRRSALYRAKWDERHTADGRTYGELTIKAALSGRTEYWTPAHDPGGPGTEREWPDPQPLPTASVTAPWLPESLLPGVLRDWIVDTAERGCVPLETIAAPAIVALGAVVGRSLGIRPHAVDPSYLVVPNLWGMDIDRPGQLKTWRMEQGLAPLKRLAARARQDYEARRLVVVAAIERIETEIEGLRAELKRASRERKADHVLRIEAELQDKLREREAVAASERRYLTHDATIEKLTMLLRDNPRGLLVVRDELAGFLRTFEKPGHEGDREFYLEAWNGTGSYTTDRVGRGTLHVPALCLSIYGTIQPGKLRVLLQDSLAGGAGDDGLLQRFQLMIWPETLPWNPVQRPPDGEAYERVVLLFEALDRLDPAGVGATIPDEGIPYLTFDPDAQDFYDAWRDKLERRLRSAELARTPTFEAHIAKYRSLLPKLALLFHLVETARFDHRGFVGFDSSQVGLRAAQLAADWCAFLECHARKVYQAELARELVSAHELARRIEQGAVRDGTPLRAIYRKGWAHLATQDDVLAALRVLERYHWVRLDTAEHERGGRPSTVVRVNPALRQGGQQ